MLLRQRFVLKRLFSLRGAYFSTNPIDPFQATKEKPKNQGVDAETLEYLQKKLRIGKTLITLDKQNYRIDIGLLISRDPIFLQLDQKDVDGLKFRLKYGKKYKLMMPLPKELTEFQEKDTTPAMGGKDELPTHEIMMPDGTRITYSANSKTYLRVDPNINDNKSIQYASGYRTYLMVKSKQTQQWWFPTTYLKDKTSFKTGRQGLFETLSQKKWNVLFPLEFPISMVKRELTKEEKADTFNRKAVGIKTFFFPAYHTDGKVEINPELYDDYAWVTRLELNKYLDRERYESIVHSIIMY